MIRYTEGNLLDAPADALVNAVNTVGVMGKGIALAFKQRFPGNYRAYVRACNAGEVTTGRMFVTEASDPHGPRWIINFPTKQHFRDPSRMEWIVSGLVDLRRVIVDESIPSIAIPALGAGAGRLAWEPVQQEIIRALGDIDSDIVIYRPGSA